VSELFTRYGRFTNMKRIEGIDSIKRIAGYCCGGLSTRAPPHISGRSRRPAIAEVSVWFSSFPLSK